MSVIRSARVAEFLQADNLVLRFRPPRAPVGGPEQSQRATAMNFYLLTWTSPISPAPELSACHAATEQSW
jgi:hypothetical protein